ncbi:MAG: hypothetical protein P8X65_11345 [Syntrophobacterales bacterium]
MGPPVAVGQVPLLTSGTITGAFSEFMPTEHVGPISRYTSRFSKSLKIIGRQKMFKRISTMMLAVLMILSLTICYATMVMAETKQEGQQFGESRGETGPQTGEAGPLKANICKNPKLCDSIEIDLLSHLAAAKVPVYLPTEKPGKVDKEYKASLALGMVVADALAGIINKDKKGFLGYAALIQDYGKQLGVSAETMGGYKKITEAAGKDQWKELGVLLYEYKDGMVNDLDKNNKKPLASLAMIAGGLEGFYITAKSVDANYSESGAKLLNNPDLITYCQSCLIWKKL